MQNYIWQDFETIIFVNKSNSKSKTKIKNYYIIFEIGLKKKVYDFFFLGICTPDLRKVNEKKILLFNFLQIFLKN